MKKLFVIVSIATLGLMTACGTAQTKRVGGPCAYNKIPGTIMINSIEPAPGNESDCKDAVKVMFTFTPTKIAARKHYSYPGWSDEGQAFTVGGGTNPSRNWVKGKGIAVGKRYEATRNEIRSGTCTPVLFRFTSIDTGDYPEDCY